ncbi:5,10-methylenetetrahydromethanopterin reductase [Candidatus Geothermarchaeota archaeon ex4572_27]|nr:MAG: 5,10-methylenetetrahydromethanopterin reductase [Candidatus Geothermarchaeota archaeon ex4572_27]
MVKFGIELVPDRPVDKVVELAVAAEQSGLDYVWVTDHYNNRNVYVTLAAMAAATKRITLGVGVTNPYVVHPVWTASAIATLDELSGGRAVLGIGAGDRATLEGIGIKWERPLTSVKEAVEVMRRLLAGEKVKLEGEAFKVAKAKLNYKPSRVPPIYVGAQGPKMLEVAGMVGDGVLINASNPKDFEDAIKYIKAGAEKAGRDFSKIDVVAYTCFSVDEDSAAAKEAAKPIVAFIVAGSPSQVLSKYGITEDEANKVREAIGRGDIKGATQLVTDRMLDAFSIAGTPSEVSAKIEQLIKAGVTQVVMGSPLGPKKKAAIGLMSQIASRFR